MKLNRVSFFTVIYPIERKFLEDFFRSLEGQTYQMFDIVVVNDGYENFEEIVRTFNDLNIRELPGTGNIPRNRELGINFCIDEGYENIVFGDCDDYFQSNRLEESLILLKDFDVVVNDLSTFNKNGPVANNYFSNRINNGDTIDYDFIADKNIFGFSNTALRLKGFSKVVISEDVFPPDWHFFKMILSDNKKAIFTNATTTFYRQHDSNMLGLGHDDRYLFWHEE